MRAIFLLWGCRGTMIIEGITTFVIFNIIGLAIYLLMRQIL